MELKKKALIFELKFHQEIIPTQILFLLDSGYEVHLFLAEYLYDKELFNGLVDKISLTLLPNTKGFINKIQLLLTLKWYLKRHTINTLIINTLDSNFINFLLRVIKDVHTIGIIHQLQKLKFKRLYHDNLKRVSGVLTLSQYTFEFLKKNYKVDKPTSFFYPIFFSYKECFKPSSGDQDIIRIVIPGQLDLSKRDYRTLITALASDKENARRFKFFLLGNAAAGDGTRIVSLLKSKGLENIFSYTEGFVTYKHFFSCLAESDYVMPLLNKKAQDLPNYRQSQISASFNWAYAFGKPLIVDEFYFDNVVTKNTCISYSDESFRDTLLRLGKPSADETDGSGNFLDFELQQQNYLKVF